MLRRKFWVQLQNIPFQTKKVELIYDYDIIFTIPLVGNCDVFLTTMSRTRRHNSHAVDYYTSLQHANST